MTFADELRIIHALHQEGFPDRQDELRREAAAQRYEHQVWCPAWREGELHLIFLQLGLGVTWGDWSEDGTRRQVRLHWV